jgi:hypothetical protein
MCVYLVYHIFLSYTASEAFFPIESTTTATTTPTPTATPVSDTATTTTREASNAAVEEEATPATSAKVDNPGEDGAAATAADAPPVAMETVRVLMLNGGMDTEGEIFDDTLIFPVS